MPKTPLKRVSDDVDHLPPYPKLSKMFKEPSLSTKLLPEFVPTLIDNPIPLLVVDEATKVVERLRR